MSDAPTNRDRVLKGEAVQLSYGRLLEMQQMAIKHEGISEGQFHWHWAAVINELIERRAVPSGGPQ